MVDYIGNIFRQPKMQADLNMSNQTNTNIVSNQYKKYLKLVYGIVFWSFYQTLTQC
jgi:hypothetical protein